MRIENTECSGERIRIQALFLGAPLTIEIVKNGKDFEYRFSSSERLDIMRTPDFKNIKPRTFAQKLSAVLEQDVKIKDTEVILAKLLPEILKHSEIFNENGRKREERR